MPTIYHRSRYEMVGTLSLCPPYEPTTRGQQPPPFSGLAGT